MVSLPNHLTGFVAVDEVSQDFGRRFEAFSAAVEANETPETNVPVLNAVYEEGQLVACCIAAVESKRTGGRRKRLELSMRPALMNAGMETADFLPGVVLPGEILSVEDRGFRVSFGLDLDLIGFLASTEVEGKPLVVGQTVLMAIKGAPCKNRIVQLTTKPTKAGLKAQSEASLHALKPGVLVHAAVSGIESDYLKVRFGHGNAFEGRIELHQLAPEIALKRAKELDLGEYFVEGQVVPARIVFVDGEERHFLLSQRLASNVIVSTPSAFKIGQIVPDCQVLRVDPLHGLLLELPGCAAYVHISRLSDEHVDKIGGSSYKVGTRHACRLVDYDPFEGLYQASMQPSVLKEAFVQVSEIAPGQLVKGVCQRVESYGLLVQLTEHIRAICPTLHLTETQSQAAAKKFAPGSKYRFRVLDVDPKARRITLTRKAGLIESELAPLTKYEDAKVGAWYDGYIAAIKEFGLIVRFYAGVKGLVTVGECSDTFQERPQDAFFVGQVVSCRVTKCNPEASELNLSLRKTTGPKANAPGKKRADKKEAVAVADSEAEDAEVEPEPKKKRSETTVPTPSAPSAVELTLDDLVEAAPAVPSTHNAASTVNEDMPSLKEIADEFEKRLLGQPNSSLLWIQYMSAMLRASETDEARAIAERALQTIRFRDGQEKLNVWIAFMNLEFAFGTPASLKKVFERANTYNDPKTVHMALAKIYQEAVASDPSALDKAKELYAVMTKKFSGSCKVWLGHILLLYLHSDTNGARKLLPAALRSLPKRKHVKITCKVAQAEYKYGSVERARTLFEGVLANAPKRVDIWSVYLTMEENRIVKATTESDDVEFTRRLLERIVHLRMSSKKAKFFFKRFLEFEREHGTAAGVEHVKNLARQYVESHNQ